MESNNDLFPNFASPLHAFIDPVIHALLIAAPERREELEHLALAPSPAGKASSHNASSPECE
jgi:hypothetical protein